MMCLIIGNGANRSMIAQHMIGFAYKLGPSDRAVAGSAPGELKHCVLLCQVGNTIGWYSGLHRFSAIIMSHT